MKKIIIILFLFCLVAASTPAQTMYQIPSIDLKTAQTFASKALDYAASKNWGVAVSVVNSEGAVILVLRGDKAYAGAVDGAIQKALSANAFKRPTSQFAAAIAQGRNGILAVKNVVPVEGGVPITLGGVHVGAIGVSGAKAIEDEECANAALGIAPAATTPPAPSAAPTQQK